MSNMDKHPVKGEKNEKKKKKKEQIYEPASFASRCI